MSVTFEHTGETGGPDGMIGELPLHPCSSNDPSPAAAPAQPIFNTFRRVKPLKSIATASLTCFISRGLAPCCVQSVSVDGSHSQGNEHIEAVPHFAKLASMKAFVIQQPGRSAIEEVPEVAPGDGDVLLQTRMVGFCGTDLNTFRGKNPLVSYPRIPGHEISATIVSVGANVPSHLRAGTNVTVSPLNSCGLCAACLRGRTNACMRNETLGVQRDGAMKEFFTAPWQKVFVAEGLSLRELSMVEPLAVGFHSVNRGRVQPSDSVAVLGCGTVGLGAIAAAARKGANVIAIDLDDHKLDLAKQAGAHHAVHSGKQNLHDALRQITSGHGPDVVVEAVGTGDTFRAAVEEVAYTGRVVYIGWAKEPVTYETKLFILKELDIMGSRNSLSEFPDVIEVLQKRQFPVEATISLTVPLSGASDALESWSNSPQAYSKILVEMA